AQHGSEECPQPLGRVHTPQNHALARFDIPLAQLRRKPPRKVSNLSVARAQVPHAAMFHYRGLASTPLHVHDQAGQMFASHSLGSLTSTDVESILFTLLNTTHTHRC